MKIQLSEVTSRFYGNMEKKIGSMKPTIEIPPDLKKWQQKLKKKELKKRLKSSK